MSRGDPRRRGRKLLTREQVLDAADELVAEGGFEALTMNRLAARLGVATMTVYTYVDSRQDLVDALTRRRLDHLDGAQGSQAGTWDERLVTVFIQLRAQLLGAPGAAAAALSAPEVSVGGSLAFTRNCVALLQEGGVDADEAVAAYLSFVTYTLGFTAFEDHGGAHDLSNAYVKSIDELAINDGPTEFLERLRRQVTDVSWDEHFRSGLERLVEGVRAKALARSTTTTEEGE